MDYDFSNQSGSGPTYDAHIPMYRAPPTHSMYGPSRLYPEVGHGQTTVSHVGRPSACHPTAPQSSSSGLGIRVLIKPQYLSTPLFNGSLHLRDIPRSSFHFDFELEREILAGEAKSEFWSELGLKHLPAEPPKSSPTTSSSKNSAIDPVVSKYVASGLSGEAVSIAVTNYGDNPTKVREFVNGYTLLQEMGFSPTSVAEALLVYDRDPEKALAHVLNGSTSE